MADQFRQINGPDGPINFPSEMSDDQVTQAMRKLYPPKQQATPNASISADTGAGAWLERAKSDIEYGGTSTWLGRGARAIGMPGINRGVPEEVGHTLGGVAYGPLEIAHGTTQLSSHPARGLLEMGSGAFHAVGPFAAASNPEFLPAMTEFSALQAGAHKVGQIAGLKPETNELVSTVIGMVGTGMANDPMARVRAVQAIKNDLKAQRGFGAQVDDSALTTAAEQMMQKAEAQANTARDIAKRTAQKAAQGLQSGAQSALMKPKKEDPTLQFGEHAQPQTPPEAINKPIESVQPPVQTRPVTPVENVKGLLGAEVGSSSPKWEETQRQNAEVRAAKSEIKAPKSETSLAGARANLTSPPESGIMVDKGEEKPVFTPRDLQQALPNKPVPKLGTLPQSDVKPAAKPDTTRVITDRMMQLRRQGLSDPEQVFQLTREFPKQAEDIIRGYKAKQLPQETPSTTEAVQPKESVQATSTPEKAGESVSQTPRPEVDTRLGQREPRSAARIQGLPDLDVFNQRVSEMLKKTPGMAEGTARRRVAEQIRNEQGAVRLGGDDDVPQRRERKINSWMDRLRDPSIEQDEALRMIKNLKAYGLDNDEIVRRMSGAKDFAKTKSEADESLEERIGDPREYSQDPDDALNDLKDELEGKVKQSYNAVDRVMGKYVEGTDARLQYQAGLEGKLTGESEIQGVKSPDIQELENIFRRHDPRREGERGSFSLRSTKGKAPPGGGIPPVQSSLADLTQKLESSLKAIPPDDSRMRIMERLDKATTEGWDKVQMSIGRMAAQAIALKDMYFREPEMTDYRSAIGRFSGALNRSAWELRQFTKEIKAKLPDALRREAVTNWIQADGDDKVLADRAARSKGATRAGYEAARTLTQDELHLASFIQQHFENRLKEAINMGILKDGLENYVPQIWKPKDQTKAGNFFSSLHRSGLLKPDFNSAKKRLFESYFEGEQAGRSPVNKDIGFLLASWDKALNQSIASRNLVRDLSYGLAKDGRPIIAPSGTGKPAYDSDSPLEGDKPNAYYIYPKAGPDETGDYVALNHSALTKWTWATKDENGTPIFMKGDLRVHPDHAQTLDNIINRGKWAAAHPVQTAILKGQGFFKQTLLAASPFHQIQEGTHALFHKVNPFNPKPIDLTNPDMGKLLDHGLVIGSYDPVGAFEEGVSSGGAVGKIPGLGRFMQKYTDYLFQDYIPRLKANMATEAYARNMERYSDHIALGKITSDQIAELTANQANAAFGELNYMMMGRSPQTQAILRMAFLAPDFLEARARFVGQALRPKGREQYAALFRGALGMYTTARILNQLLDDDPHWDKPFSLIVHGFEYKIRSLPGDIWHMLDDHNSFIMHRLNPTLVKPLYEFASGKDDFGRKRTLGEQAFDFARGVVPISMQGFMKSGNQSVVDGLISGLGVTRSKYRTKAGALAHQYAIGSIPNDITSHHVADIVNDIQNGTIDSSKIGTLLREGKMNPADFVKARNLARLPELYRNYHRLPVEQKAKVWMAATPKERALLRRYSSKELDVTKLLPEQREEFMQHFSDQ